MDRHLERRVAEASALRTLFHDQWLQLKRLIKRQELERLRWKRDQQRLCAAVEVIVEGTDHRMRGVSRYQKRLRNSARGLLNHIGQLITELPPALDLSRQQFGAYPLTGTIFRGPGQVSELFSRNQAIQRYFLDPAHREKQEVFALLFFSYREKSCLGSELRGDLIVREVLQTRAEFGSHRLVAPCVSETQARGALKRVLFETSVEYLHGYMARLRHGLLDTAERAELPGQGEGVDDPEIYLQVLEWLMSLPLELIRINSNLVRIDSMGTLITEGTEVAARELELKEIGIGRAPGSVVTIVRYPRDELAPAVQFPAMNC